MTAVRAGGGAPLTRHASPSRRRARPRAGGHRVPGPPHRRARARGEHHRLLPPRPAPLRRVPGRRPASRDARARSPSPTSPGSSPRCAPGDDDHPPLSATSAARAVVAVRGLHRFALLDGLVPDDVAARGAAADAGPAAAQGGAGRVGRGADRGGRRARGAARACGTGRCSSCSTAPARASPRRSGWPSTTSTGGRRWCGWPARAARSGSSRSAATRCGRSRSTWCGARPALAAKSRGGVRGGPLFLNVRGGPLSRQSAWAILRRGGRARRADGGDVAAHAAALLRDPPARRRRRRPRRPGTARPRLGDDDAGLHAGDRRPAARGVRHEPPAGHRLTPDPAAVLALFVPVRLEWSQPLSHVAMSTCRAACLLGNPVALPSVVVTRAGRTADRDRKPRIGHEVEATDSWRPERTRLLPSRARTTATPRWGPRSRQDPARARQRPLPDPKPLTEHGPGPRHRDVQPEGRRRQDDVDDQPGRRADRVRPARCC